MRLFALRDAADLDCDVLAVLSCRGDAREYCIDMPAGTDPWNVPLLLSSFAARGWWCIDGDWALRWVESRLVPQSRQNLGEVLKVNGLDRYDTLRLLELTQGRNSQDDCYLQPVREEDAPDWFAERERGSIADAVLLDSRRLFVAFRSGDAVVCSLDDLAGARSGGAAPTPEDGLGHVEVSLSGRSVTWGRGCAAMVDEVRACGRPVGLSWDDLSRIAPALLVDGAEAAGMLGCSRQNVSDLARRRVLPVARSGGRSTLFLRADVRKRV